LRNNDLGDVLLVTPLLRALRRKFPEARIAAGVGDWAAPVLEGNRDVGEVIPVNAPWHNGKVRPQGLGPALRYIAGSPEVRRIAEGRYEIGIDVLGSAYGSLLMMRAGIPFRLGVRGYAGGHSGAQRHLEFDSREHVARFALRFAEMLGASDLPENRPIIELPAPPAPGGSIIFAPGGGYREKCWPVDRFVTLAQLLPEARITVIGGETEREAGARLAALGPRVSDLTGRLTLRESFAAIAAAPLVVCNSSMAMHAAAAFARPCTVVLGPGVPSAPAHAAQWAYPETRVLAMPTPEAVRDCIRSGSGSGAAGA
jgi:heptosyltransferase-2